MFPAGRADVRARMVTLADGLVLRVAESGPKAGPPVLLLHGWGASIYMWRDWFGPLAGAGFRVVAVDLPAHGLSSHAPGAGAYGLPSLVARVRELMSLEKLDDGAIVAQSMGGSIAVELALLPDRPVGRLVLVNPALFGKIRLQALAGLVSQRVVAPVIHRLVPRWIVARAHRMVYGDPSRITPRDIDEYWAPSQFPSYARSMLRLVHEFSWRRAPVSELGERLRGLPAPALVVLGGRDRLVRDARPYVRALCEAGAPLQVHEIPRAGHAANEECPELILPRVLAYLRGEAAPRP